MKNFLKHFFSRFLIAICLFSFLAGNSGCSGGNADTMLQQGDDALAAGNPDEAVIWYKKAIQQDAELAVAHYKLGKIYHSKGNVQLAFGELTQALTQNSQLADARKELIFLLVEQRSLSQAATVCEEYLKDNGDDEEIYLILGNSLAYTKKIDDALEVLRKGQGLYPENLTLKMNLAKILVVKGEVEEGRSMMEKLASKNPDDSAVQIALAQLYEKLERYDLAVMSLESVKQKEPENGNSYIALAQLYLKKNQPEIAKTTIKEAEKAGVNDSRLFQMYAMISHRQGNSDDALAYFKKTVDAATDENRSINQIILADYYTFLKQYNKAQAILENVIAEDSSKRRLRSKVVELFMAQGDFDQAKSSVDSLLSEDSSDARGHFLKGLMLMKEKDVVEARKQFSIAKELAPNAAENQFLYGMTFMNESEQISITEISEALKKNPNLLKARMALAELYAKTGELQKSLDELDKILSIQADQDGLGKVSGKKENTLKIKSLRIGLLLKMNMPAEALEDAKYLVEFQPKDMSHVFRLAEIYYSTKKFDDALPLYEKLQEAKPDNVQILSRIVGVFVLKEQQEQAMEAVDSFLAKYPENSTAIVLKAKIYLSQGYTDLAENILIPEADKAKDFAPIVMLAELYRSKNENEQAISYYKKVQELVPENIVIRMKLADLYLKTAKNEEAIESYEGVLKLKADFLPAMNNLAFLYSEEHKNLDRALELANEVARKIPDNPDVSDTLGWIYFMKNVYSQAEPYLQIALTEKPDHPIIVYHMGMLRFGQKEMSEAEELLTKAIQKGLGGTDLEKANSTLVTIGKLKQKYQSAKSEKEKGNGSKAIELYEQILDSDGFSSGAAADLAILYVEQKNDISEAMELARKAYDARPSDPHTADALGWVYYHQGSLLMAKQYIEQAIEKDTNYGTAYVHLGAVFIQKEEPEAAKKALETAKSMDLSVADQKQVKKLMSELVE
jgi:tetratricopeptide (TPR) repeat protein